MVNANREAFLNRLAQKSGHERHQLADHPFVPINNLPETTLSGKSPAELLSLAHRNSEAVHVTFKTATTSNLDHLLEEFIHLKNIQHLILPTFEDSKWHRFGLVNWKQHQRATYWEPNTSRKNNLDRADAADGAIGFADFLLAESGTITVATQPGQGRGFHFLPTHYLSIIPQSRIVPRSRQAMNYYDDQIKQGLLQTSNINFITGPSNSGDIEMVLVVGVHGPLDMTYVVVTDL